MFEWVHLNSLQLNWKAGVEMWWCGCIRLTVRTMWDDPNWCGILLHAMKIWSSRKVVNSCSYEVSGVSACCAHCHVAAREGIESWCECIRSAVVSKGYGNEGNMQVDDICCLASGTWLGHDWTYRKVMKSLVHSIYLLYICCDCSLSPKKWMTRVISFAHCLILDGWVAALACIWTGRLESWCECQGWMCLKCIAMSVWSKFDDISCPASVACFSHNWKCGAAEKWRSLAAMKLLTYLLGSSSWMLPNPHVNFHFYACRSVAYMCNPGVNFHYEFCLGS